MKKTLLLATLGTIAIAPSAHAQSCDKPNILILLDVSGSMADTDASGSSRMKEAMDGIDAALGATNIGGISYQNLANWALGVFPEPFTGAEDSDGYYSNGFCHVATHSSDQSIVTKVSFGTGNRAAIHTALNAIYNNGSGPPTSDDTPIYQALQAGANSAAFKASASNYILLVTDGQQDCIPHSAKPKPTTPELEGDFDGTVDGSYSGGGEDFSEDNVPAFRTLVNDIADNDNVTIYAVGFNIESTDTPDGARTLNMISATAGTSIAGCDAQETDPSQADNCYYQATDANSLQSAIGAIVAQINNGGCGNTSNLGICHDGVWQCQGGVNVCVGVVGPEEEQCDGLDHDCDGHFGNIRNDGLDNSLTKGCGGIACEGTLKCQAVAGSSIPDQFSNTCQIAGGGAGVCDCKSGVSCGTISAGCKAEGAACACTTGVQTCVDEGSGILGFGDCVGATQPMTETCNGLDDNCDGQIDEGTAASCLTSCGTPGTRACMGKAGLSNDCVPNEGACECNSGDTRPCGTSGNGCQQGQQICQYGQWTTGCIGGSQGATEVCNGLDDDCDGKIDNGAVCPSGETCVCGACEPACNGTSCSNGGQCDAQDVCQIDYCPNGTCDQNGQCNSKGLPTQTQSAPVVKDTPALNPAIKTVASGCGCRDTQPVSGLLAMLFIGILPLARTRLRKRL